jgi:hypothetical protein
MARVVQARLDRDAEVQLERLRRRTGQSESALVRRGLALLDASERRRSSRVIGLGKFESGKRDLGSNKKHLRGFGR